MSKKPKEDNSMAQGADQAPEERYEFTVKWTSRGMTYGPGVPFSRAFLEGRGVDINYHLEKKLLVKAKEKK